MEENVSFMRTTASIAPFVAGCAMIVGCATAPSTRADRNDLRETAAATLGEMITRDPALRDVTRDAPAYAVFPSVGKGGVLVGGAFGRGILYEGGVATGYVSLQQASLGAQLGGKRFSELLILRSPADIAELKAGRYTVGADLGVVMLTSGAAEHAGVDSAANVFVLPRGGLMVEVSVSGQQVKYQSFDA